MKKFFNVISLTLAVTLMSGCQIHKQDTKVDTQVNSEQSIDSVQEEFSEGVSQSQTASEEKKTIEAECTDNTNSNLGYQDQSGKVQASEKLETNEQSDPKAVILSEVNGQTSVEVSEEKVQEKVVESSQSKAVDEAQANAQLEVKESVATVSNTDQSSDAVQAVETKSVTAKQPIVKSTTKSAQVQKPATTQSVQVQKPTATTKPVQTQKPAATKSAAKPEQQKSIVTLAVYSDEDTILSAVEVKLEDKETVFDVLKKTLKDKKIQFEYTGKGDSVYVEGINNLYEFDKGSTSGWMYNVNGTYPNKSAGSYTLKAGDTIEWRYTLDLGKDLGVNTAKK